jgi:hypothetical protein
MAQHERWRATIANGAAMRTSVTELHPSCRVMMQRFQHAEITSGAIENRELDEVVQLICTQMIKQLGLTTGC